MSFVAVNEIGDKIFNRGKEKLCWRRVYLRKMNTFDAGVGGSN
jgi:hypothetical protein